MVSQVRSNNTARGFTLVELLVVVAIVALLIGAAEPTFHTYVSQTSGQDAQTVLVEMVHRAQTLSMSGRGDSAWGIKLATSTITVFKGATYASRDTNYDEVFRSSIPFYIGSTTEYVFTKVTGTTTPATTTVMIDTGHTSTYVINGRGVITY